MPWLALAIGAMSIAGGLADTASALRSPEGLRGFIDSWRLAEVSIALNFAAVGAFLASRRPDNPIGWLLLYQGWSGNGVPGSLALSVPWAGPLALLLLLLPHGRLPSPRWRPVLALELAVVAAIAIGSPLQLRVAGLPVWDLLEPVLLLSIVVGVVALVVRHRRASGTERAQLRLLALVGGASVVALFIGAALRILPLVNAIAIPAIPWGIAACVLRYRLYDIDRLISRGVTYALLTVVLASTYTGVVLGVETVVGPDDRPAWVVAGATLLVAALFQPVRVRLQSHVDRSFNRRRYDAAREVEAFSMRIRDHVDLDDLVTDLRTVVRGTVEPAHVGLWLLGP